jgi:hypothetical protein
MRKKNVLVTLGTGAKIGNEPFCDLSICLVLVAVRYALSPYVIAGSVELVFAQSG